MNRKGSGNNFEARRLPGGTEENGEGLQLEYLASRQVFELGTSRNKSQALPLSQLAPRSYLEQLILTWLVKKFSIMYTSWEHAVA
jgi:hypothetical protein